MEKLHPKLHLSTRASVGQNPSSPKLEAEKSTDPKATDSQSQDKTPKTISLDLGKLLPDVIS